MLTREEADPVAEKAVVDYAEACGVETPDDLRKALELLISKAALAIEKECSPNHAMMVLHRTLRNVERRYVESAHG